jgi:hypothetical protein
MPYIYCFRVKGLYDNKNVYKFGKTNQNNVLERLNGYSGLNKPEKFILISYVKNADLLEKKILSELREKYNFVKELGLEYFYSTKEIDLHRFLKEMEIKYYNYKENAETHIIIKSNCNTNRIECPFECSSPRASSKTMLNHLEKQCKKRPSNSICVTSAKNNIKYQAIDKDLENIVGKIWGISITNKIPNYC